MKNTISNLLRNLYYIKIPPEILDIGFAELRKKNNSTTDAIIREYIIVDLVLVKCNLYAGKVKKIVLYENYGMHVNDDTFEASMSGNYGMYRIPPEARENRPLSALLDIGYPTTMALYGTFPNEISVGRSVANSADEALASFTETPIYMTPAPMLIDGDAGIISLQPPAALHIDWILSCMLTYDKDFSNLSLNMLPSLQNMVEFATKAYIYNTMIVKINQGYLQGGQSLDAIKEIISSYADAGERFDEALRKFRGAATFSTENFRNMLSMMLGS